MFGTYFLYALAVAIFVISIVFVISSGGISGELFPNERQRTDDP